MSTNLYNMLQQWYTLFPMYQVGVSESDRGRQRETEGDRERQRETERETERVRER